MSRIASEAARLVSAQGLLETTVEQIAAAADVGRATFFRYYDTKEGAVAEGFSGPWLAAITERLAAQPAELSATEALRAAFAELSAGFDDDVAEVVLDLARLSRSTPALSAWTLQLYLRYEDAIAELVAPRFRDLAPSDPRPRLVGAMAMAAVRIALDDWVRDGGSLPDLVQRAVCAMSVDQIAQAPPPKAAACGKEAHDY